jgi:hypothetical protein
MKIIDKDYFENIWNEKINDFVGQKIKDFDIKVVELNEIEKENAIRVIVDFLLSEFVVYAGEHRFNDWDKGWGENLNDFEKTRSINSIIPKYFGKYPINRLNRKFVKSEDNNYEVKMLSILQYWIFDKYFKEFHTIYEFGCGTGHNLLRVREVNKHAKLWGMDWAPSSQTLINGIAKLIDLNLFSHNFDYYKPDLKFRLEKNSAVYTFASLEQTGDNYKDFIQYLIENKPSICVHIEPTSETLDEENLLDFLSIKYFKKRNYLNGFINYLKELESQNILNIIDIKRSFIGSYYIDGYSIIIWKPYV